MTNLILFYEKPGCTTNARQKRTLSEAGCMVIEQNLLEISTSMGEAELHSYLEALPVRDWFNPNAPAVKRGDIDPAAYSAEEALTLLLDDPILIKRPLLSVNGHRMCGFDQAKIESLLGATFSQKVDNSCTAAADDACRES